MQAPRPIADQLADRHDDTPVVSHSNLRLDLQKIATATHWRRRLNGPLSVNLSRCARCALPWPPSASASHHREARKSSEKSEKEGRGRCGCTTASALFLSGKPHAFAPEKMIESPRLNMPALRKPSPEKRRSHLALFFPTKSHQFLTVREQ